MRQSPQTRQHVSSVLTRVTSPSRGSPLPVQLQSIRFHRIHHRMQLYPQPSQASRQLSVSRTGLPCHP
ncbi:hypothetical protein FGO68_gene11635 [Halteria grandinella]|uniref:Uncharacterized protein n=1 Tax=Halteria grandinella TaxID=5974 RepID=A0A8J8NHH2_HALGN|nr:hypothetical protein FGO68_gene11635 [Halteria grandinella]